MDLAVDAQVSIPNSILLPVLVPIELSQTVFPTRIRQDRFHLTETTGSSMLDHDFGTCVVVDVFKYLDNFEFSGTSMHVPF